MTERDIKKLIA